MLEHSINIVCLEQEGQLARFISSVYSAIDFRLQVVQTKQNLENALEKETAHLCVIDGAQVELDSALIDTIFSKNPQLELVIVQPQGREMNGRNALSSDRLHFLPQSSVVTRLPQLLGEIYAKLSQRANESPKIQHLLKEALDWVEPVVLISNMQGKLIFLNRSGRQILGIEDIKHGDFFTQDFLEDGTKIWHFLLDYFKTEDQPLSEYPLVLLNNMRERYPGRARIRRVELDEDFLLIQVSEIARDETKFGQALNGSALPDFADAVANELLNPVNVISGRIQLLKSQLEERDGLEATITGLQKQIQRINETINRLVTFASLKPENVMQKVQVEESLKRLRSDSLMQEFTAQNPDRLTVITENDLPPLLGHSIDFDILFGIVSGMVIRCLGPEGSLEIRAGKDKERGKENLVVVFNLQKKNITNVDCQVQKQLKIEKSIESSIAKHIIYTYNGEINFLFPNPNTEQIEIKFPIANPYNVMEVQ